MAIGWLPDMVIVHNPPEAPVKVLLAEAGLLADDITAAHLEHFLGAWSGSKIEGVVGVELHGPDALLRSLAVTAESRSAGLGSELVAAAESYAAQKGVRSLFLLTTMARGFFEKLGYTEVARESAPDAIRGTREFSAICPESAVFMVKHLLSFAQHGEVRPNAQPTPSLPSPFPKGEGSSGGGNA